MMPIGKIAEPIGVEGIEGSNSRNLVGNRDGVKRKLKVGYVQKTTAELMERFMTADIWAAPVNHFPDVECDPQVEHNQTIIDFEHPVAGNFRTIGPPVKFSRTPTSIHRPPPLGDHTSEIHDELVYDARGINKMTKSQGVCAGL